MGVRVGGITSIVVDGVTFKLKATDTKYNPGVNKKEGVVGADGPHGYKELPQIPWLETAFTDDKDLDVKALFSVTDADVQVALANGKGFVLRNAWYAGDGEIGTEEGEISIRFEGLKGFEV